MSNKIFGLAFILIILALGLFSAFFTANNYQDDPEYFIAKKKFSINNPEISTREKQFMDDYTIGEFYLKEGKFEEAQKHFHRVYHNYPNVPKGLIKLNALHYMKDISDILQRQNSLRDNPDTNYLVKEYFKYKP